MKHRYFLTLITLLSLTFKHGNAQDTLNIMTYNVLHYGDGCQGSNTFLHSQLKTIVQFANPDILGFVKAQSIKVTPTDNNGISPYGFADSIIVYALDIAHPGRYNYCTLTNTSASNDMDILFYNQSKLGFVSVTSLCTLSEDFNLYKLYYKDPYLGTTHDSTFLYVVLNHTVSGTSTSGRDQQDTVIINKLKTIFYHLPNLISMGDFNTHASLETGYQAYTNTKDTSFAFYDAPFNPDHNLTYPISWEAQPTLCPAYLNTTTRASASIPNSCGTNGGAKDWFIHILFSGWMLNNTDFIKYVPHSYTTIGNDGKRFSISENDSTTNGKNTSAPSNVINAIFQLSDKYPIMARYAITFDSLGNGPTNPIAGINNIALAEEKIEVNNPVQNNITIHFPTSSIGEKCHLNCFDICGRKIMSKDFTVNSTTVTEPNTLKTGTYIVTLQTNITTEAFCIVEL